MIEVFPSTPKYSIFQGLSIYYPQQTQTNPPVAYPWTIGGQGDDLTVKSVFLVNSYMVDNVKMILNNFNRELTLRQMNALATTSKVFMVSLY